MTTYFDQYLSDGCGRCSFYKTAECKVHSWNEELKALRKIVLDCGLEEEIKWSQPCYTMETKNVLLVSAFKNFATIAFFKGSLMKDTNNMLISPGQNNQAIKHLRFTDVNVILEKASIVKAYVLEAIAIEKSGAKVKFEKNPEPFPEELKDKLNEDLEFKLAFESLTPGRQRGYILHFSQPKQSKTRLARISKCESKILNGKGFHDDYKIS